MIDMSEGAISSRLRSASSKSDLAPERRLDAKLDLSPSGVERRLREASDLLSLCERSTSCGPALCRPLAGSMVRAFSGG
jgi:hypothetical protein